MGFENTRDVRCEEYAFEALALALKAQETARKLRRSISKIPKPSKDTQLFSSNGLDRLYSNIPYPSSSASLRPTLAKYYKREEESNGARGFHKETSPNPEAFEGPYTAYLTERTASMEVEWDWESSVSGESLSDSVFSLNTSPKPTEKEPLEEALKTPTLKPLQRTFLKDCMKTLNIKEESTNKSEQFSKTSEFCSKTHTLLTEYQGRSLLRDYDISDKRRKPKQRSYLQVASVGRDPTSQPLTGGLVQQFCDSHEDYNIKAFIKDLDHWTSDPPSYEVDWNDKVLKNKGCSKGVVLEEEGDSCCTFKSSRGRGSWFSSALGASLKMLAVVSGVAILAQNAQTNNQCEFASVHDASNLDFPDSPTSAFYNSGAYPLSLLELDSFESE